MELQELKNQHTLYRFVSLRNPELTKKENQNKRFVFHPDNKSGVFFKTMNVDNVSNKWQNLLSISSTFPAISSLENLESLVGKKFFDFANWLASNRSNYDSEVVLKNLKDLKPLDPKKLEIDLWDNLFYQVVTQKDFYIKENIIQILVLNNLLKETITIIAVNEKLEFLNLLLKARVVLPTLLFEQEPDFDNNSEARIANQDEDIEEIQLENRIAANINITNLEKVQAEISRLEKNYNKEFEKAYKIALTNYQAKTKPIIDKYQKDWNIEKRKQCQLPRPDNFVPNDYCNLPDIQLPDLPQFEFSLAPKINSDALRLALTIESFVALENIDALQNNDTYAEISEKIQEAIILEQKKVLANTNFSTPVLLVGGIAISLKSNRKTAARGKDDNLGQSFTPQKFGIRNIGIADYKKVVSHVCCYDAGEVAHIENIMAKELRSKTTTREHIEEYTETSETQQESESLTDTTTTDRFEMQTEVSKLLAEDRQQAAYANLNASYGPVSIDLGANFASNTSKEESNRQAVTQAKDLTSREMERIVTKMRKETIKKTTERFKEENVHAFDNTLGEDHVSGVYRFINAIYKNQILNYGKRMMYEFMIPQPSKLHLLGMSENADGLKSIKLKIPLDPKKLGINSFADIDEFNYQDLASANNAEVNIFPEKVKYLNKTFSGTKANLDELYEGNHEIVIPQEYFSESAQIKMFCKFDNYMAGVHIVNLSLGNINVYANEKKYSLNENNLDNYQFVYLLDPFTDKISFSYSIINYISFTISVSIKLQISVSAITKWKKETYSSIIKAYELRMQEYLSSMSDNIASRDSNPGFYRQIEQLVLRKNCISYLMDETKMGQGFYGFTNQQTKNLSNFHINQTEDMDNYANFVKFMEQAFEWNLMSYNFYPFYWGKRDDWSELYQYDCNDPLFRSFMQAGMARVVVTVKPGFENAVLHYMTTGQIWNGGQIPVLGNPLYLSLVDEITEQEYTVEETWETVVPTSLVALQNSGVAIDAGGLPCGDDCKDHIGNQFRVNDKTLGKKIVDTLPLTKL